ncbi:MAG: hypothetical protein R2867_00800 [Caldilineaceae bacterium]
MPALYQALDDSIQTDIGIINAIRLFVLHWRSMKRIFTALFWPRPDYLRLDGVLGCQFYPGLADNPRQSRRSLQAIPSWQPTRQRTAHNSYNSSVKSVKTDARSTPKYPDCQLDNASFCLFGFFCAPDVLCIRNTAYAHAAAQPTPPRVTAMPCPPRDLARRPYPNIVARIAPSPRKPIVQTTAPIAPLWKRRLVLHRIGKILTTI